MLRRAAFTVSALAAGLAVACGRQVTPDKILNNNLLGKMLIRFRTRAAMDFSNVNYVIVFNTSGTGGEPYANVYQTTLTNYSYAFVLGASYGGATALPTLLQFYLAPGSSGIPNANRIVPDPSLTTLQLNSNPQGSEFTLIFDRRQFAIPSPNQSATPSPGPSATPTPTPSPSPTPTPNPSPTATATSSPAPTGPSPAPTTLAQSTWFINLITTDTNGIPLDALGFGVTDTSFVYSIDTTQLRDDTLFRPSGVNGAANDRAAIIGAEILNTP